MYHNLTLEARVVVKFFIWRGSDGTEAAQPFLVGTLVLDQQRHIRAVDLAVHVNQTLVEVNILRVLE